jgi:hypothetical protein
MSVSLRCGLVAALAALAAAAPPSGAAAQEAHGPTLTGVVKDQSGKPVAGADVTANPDAHRTRTDSAGRFVLTGLAGGSYTVRARKLGYAPADPWTADFSKNSHLEITLELGRAMPMLDTVIVTADGRCSARSLDGFTCRRQRGKGTFLDYTEIDEKDERYTADLFRTIEGFRVELRPRRGDLPTRVLVPTTGFRCLVQLVDGHPVNPANRIPEYAGDIVAIEVYRKRDEVPKEYQTYVFQPCTLVLYWTTLARPLP